MNKDIQAIRRLGLGRGVQSDLPPLPEGTSTDWKETDWRVAEGPASQFLAGSWEGQPGEIPVDYPYGEFCFITSGRIALEDAKGNRAEFAAGDAFHVPKGFSGRWITIEAASKHYVIVE
ncbi:MAG: cupin domain-containing protein [Hydrogenophaga sp.]|jgi:hypothetical protein|nr:cupin domain-containing protein [Hydrogenophaga sp.]